MTRFRATRVLPPLGPLLGAWVAICGLGVGCLTPSAEPEARTPVGDEEAEIDPALYSRHDDANDPYRDKYAEFRERRARDMADPGSPRPLERYPARHQTQGRPWGDLEALLRFDWDGMRRDSPDRVAQLVRAVRLRRGFDHPDLEILQLMIGAGGILPAHADGAPGAFVVVGGRGEIRVEDETWRVTTGTTVKLEPYVLRRIVASEQGPLRIVWIRWAPGGDQAYIDAGYYLTGANQHIQPAQSDMPDDYLFWGEVDGAYGPVDSTRQIAPAPRGSVYARAEHLLEAVRGRLGDATRLYPGVPVFGHESRISWLSAETLRKGGFFFSEDLGSLVLAGERMIRIARHKAIFRATRPDGRWDFNFSESAWGPRSTYVEHSHVIPEFYYVLSGPVIYGVDGERHRSLAGDILFNNSYSPHLAQGIVDGLVFRSFSSTFAPNGDRSVFSRPAYLIEPLPLQPGSADQADDVRFH